MDGRSYEMVSLKGIGATDVPTLLSLQGLVNREGPRIYLLPSDDDPVNYTSEQMGEFGGIKDRKGADWVDPEMVDRYMHGIPNALGFYQGWERIPGEGVRWVAGKAWCPTVSLVRDDIDGTIREFEQAAAEQPRPAFLAGHVNYYKADMDVVIEVVRRLGEKGYTVVRSDKFLRLAEDANANGLRGS